MKDEIYVVVDQDGPIAYDSVDEIGEEYDGAKVGVYKLVRVERFHVNRYLDQGESSDG